MQKPQKSLESDQTLFLLWVGSWHETRQGQAHLRDTVWKGQVQKMVFSTNCILENNPQACKLMTREKFLQTMTILEQKNNSLKNHRCLFLPSILHSMCIYEVICKAKANNSTTPRKSLYSRTKELPWVGFEPTTLIFLGVSVLPILPGQLSRQVVQTTKTIQQKAKTTVLWHNKHSLSM